MRHKNIDWDLPDGPAWTHVHAALMMDIRDELQQLNAVFACPNFTRMPKTMREILRQFKLQRRCPMHPRYTARYEPTTGCRACRRFWNAVWK